MPESLTTFELLKALDVLIDLHSVHVDTTIVILPKEKKIAADVVRYATFFRGVPRDNCVFNKGTKDEERVGPHFVMGKEVFAHAIYVLRSLLECIYTHLPSFRNVPVSDQVSPLWALLRVELTDFVSVVKYLIAFPMAKFLGNELPKRPSVYPTPLPGGTSRDLLFSGKAKRMLENRLVARNSKSNLSLWLSFLQGVKRGAKTVPSSFVQATYEKHKVALSTVKKDFGDWNLAMEILDVADQAVKGFSSTRGPKVYEASTSAGFGVGRNEGGQREVVRNLPDDPRQRSSVSRYLAPDELQDLVEVTGFGHRHVVPRMRQTWMGKSYKEAVRIVREQDIHRHLRTRIDEESFEDSVEFIERGGGFQEDDLDWRIEVKRSNIFDDPFAGLRDPKIFGLVNHNAPVIPVKIAAVLEPLKVRLVSAGEPLFYWISKYFQKEMWDYLQTFPQFVLTGRPLMESDLHDLIAREAAFPNFVREGSRLGLDWVSGDYSAATDNIRIKYTEAIFEGLLERVQLPSFEKDLLRSVIYEQVITYPEGAGIEPFLQRGGQLMGSTLSFPILCLVNLAAYAAAFSSRYGILTKMSLSFLRKLPVLVNGDDILFRATTPFQEHWKGYVTEAGFELSIGKNYIHRHFLMVNSEGWRHTFEGGSHRFEYVPYVNCGLLIGQSKITGRESTRLMCLADVYRETVYRGPNGPGQQSRLHQRFVHYHLQEIKDQTRNGQFNLFASNWLGGLGFPRVPGVDPKFTSFQRQFATFSVSQVRQIDRMELRDDIPVLPGISLVPLREEAKAVSRVTRKRWRTFRTVPLGSVLGRHESLASEIQDEWREKPLVLPMEPSVPTLRPKFPSRETMEEFRKHGWNLRKKDRMSDHPPVVIQVKSFFDEEGNGPFPFVDPVPFYQ